MSRPDARIPALVAFVVVLCMLSQGTFAASVADFGAKGDGEANVTEAFKKAFASGEQDIYVPPGNCKPPFPRTLAPHTVKSNSLSVSCAVTPLRPLPLERQDTALRDIKKIGSKLYFFKVQVVPRTYDFTFRERATDFERMDDPPPEPVKVERRKYEVMEILDGRFPIPIYDGLFELRFK
jgi:hypothetical protein